MFEHISGPIFFSFSFLFFFCPIQFSLFRRVAFGLIRMLVCADPDILLLPLGLPNKEG